MRENTGRVQLRLSTTDSIAGFRVARHLGLIASESCVAPEGLKDLESFIREVEGGRHPGFERMMSLARNEAIASFNSQAMEMGANAVVGVDLDYAFLTDVGLLMITLSGTAVVIEPLE